MAISLGDDVGPWPAFVDLLSAAALLFLVLFAVIAVPLMRKQKEASGVQTKIDALSQQLTAALVNRHVAVERKANFLFLRIEGDATFPRNESDITQLQQEGKNILRELADVVQNGNMMDDIFQFQVVGHSSVEGESSTNWSLSAARAAAVAQFLVDSLHLDPCKVSAVGRGIYYPVDPASATQRPDPRDRRIEVEVLPRFPSDSVQNKLLKGCVPRRAR